MNKIYIIYVIFCYCIVSCTNSNRVLSSTDTVEVFSTIFKSKKIVEDFYPQNTDTIFILQSKILNNITLPSKIKNLNIKYIADTEINRRKNEAGVLVSDGGLRYLFTKFNFKKDTLNVTIYSPNLLIDYNYFLIKKKDEWHIIKFDWSIE